MRAIAFYLPQFHPIPENDLWWGKGFTEWTNVAGARRLFPGHQQPHIPADLGFYDLRLPEIRKAQADLARRYGIHGFCYYHYWFNGRCLLERPFEEVLLSGEPDFPFCICWANENWTRAWDGGERHILLEQHYSSDDDRRHMEYLTRALLDRRYIRINGRPLLLVYRTELLPDPARTASIWRDVAREAGVGEIYLARAENFTGGLDPSAIGFDAAVEFSPNSRNVGQRVFSGPVTGRLSRWNVLPRAYSQHSVFRYSAIAEGKKTQLPPPYKQFRCVTPRWDNTPRRRANGRILLGSTPELYRAWLSAAVRQTKERLSADERIVFINAWNEWAEGCHLEPDTQWGHAYLQSTREALTDTAVATSAEVPIKQDRRPSAGSGLAWLRGRYWRFVERLRYLSDIGRLVIRLPVR